MIWFNLIHVSFTALIYFMFGLLWTRGIIEDSPVIIESYNVTGILLGVSWFLHFTIISKNKSKEKE